MPVGLGMEATYSPFGLTTQFDRNWQDIRCTLQEEVCECGILRHAELRILFPESLLFPHQRRTC
jgi:hypothetical protein